MSEVKNKKATITDVARVAKVSKKTVSRVLNSEPNVKAETVKKVKAVMKQLDYHPSISARALASKRSYLISILYFDYGGHYIYELQNGLSEHLNEHGYSLILQPCPENQAAIIELIEQKVRQLNIDGFVLSPSLASMENIVEALTSMSKPVVRIGPTSKDPNDNVEVSGDEYMAAYDMTQHLLEVGYETIGFIAGRRDRVSSHLRLKGFKKAMKEAGIKVPASHILYGNFRYESGVKCAEKLLSLDLPPEAIFASNDLMAAGVMSVAHRLGYEIPSDLAIAGFDDSPLSQQLWPALTTVSQPNRKLAKIAGQRLLDQINQREVSSNELLQCSVITRASTVGE